MAKRLPFNKRERHRATQHGLGYRPTNNWGDGDLPAPWAEGDILLLPDGFTNDRLRGMGPGYFVVAYATSIDEGDAWYFRVWDCKNDARSDRLHVAYSERCSAAQWPDDLNWMASFELVDTADPEGLAERGRLLAAGWALTDAWEVCPVCGHTSQKVVSDD
jgi:hypothetical protein